MTPDIAGALFDAGPARSIIVQEGRSSWWGVDPSTRGVSIAGTAGEGDRWVRSVVFPQLVGPQRLSVIYAETRSLMVGMLSVLPWPGVVFVEQPSGSKQQVNHELEFAVGVVQAALYDAVLEVCGVPCRFEMSTASYWKKRVLGRGDFKKPTPEQRKAGVVYEALRWARLNGYDGTSWDEADSLCMAEAMHREVALLVR